MKKMAWICILFCCACLFSCGEETKKEDPRLLLIGNWRISRMNTHTVLTLRNNGSWQSEDRVEGTHTKIVEKKGKGTGRWEMESGKRLVFSVETAEEAAPWPAGSMQSFDILTLEPRTLVLQDEKERTWEWTKIRASRPEEGEVLAHQAVPMPPLIVNLSRTRLLERQRFLCLELEFILSLDEPVPQTPELIPPPPPLHPEVREALLFYLSSLEYKDLNSFERVKEHRLNLRKILNPYFDNRLQEIEVRNIIVASSRESLEEFILQYPELRHEFGLKSPEPPAKPEKNPDTGETTEG